MNVGNLNKVSLTTEMNNNWAPRLGINKYSNRLNRKEERYRTVKKGEKKVE